MTETETIDLLMRMYTIWPSAMPPENRRKTVREEWQRLLAKRNAPLLNEALDRYAVSPAGKYMPKPGELLQICDNILEEEERRQSLEGAEKCPLCYGKGRALLDAAALSPDYAESPVKAADLFDGHYGSLGIPCPCRWPEELKKLRQGQQVRRYKKKRLPNGQKVAAAYLEMWMERGRLYGRLRNVEPSSPVASEPPVRQQSIKPAFEDWPPLEDLPF